MFFLRNTTMWIPAHVLLQQAPTLLRMDDLATLGHVCKEWRAEYPRLRKEHAVQALLREWPQLVDFEETELLKLNPNIVQEWQDNLQTWKLVEPFEGCWVFPSHCLVGHAPDTVTLVHQLAMHNYDDAENAELRYGVFTLRNMAGWMHDLICIHQGVLEYPRDMLDSLRLGHVYDVPLARKGGRQMLIDSLKWLLNVNAALDELFGAGTTSVGCMDDFYTKPAVFVWWMVLVHFLSAMAHAPFNWLLDSLQSDTQLIDVCLKKLDVLDGNLEEARDFPPYPEEVAWAHDVETMCDVVPVLIGRLQDKKRVRTEAETMSMSGLLH